MRFPFSRNFADGTHVVRQNYEAGPELNAAAEALS
jgi:hypothetical protein